METNYKIKGYDINYFLENGHKINGRFCWDDFLGHNPPLPRIIKHLKCLTKAGYKWDKEELSDLASWCVEKDRPVAEAEVHELLFKQTRRKSDKERLTYIIKREGDIRLELYHEIHQRRYLDASIHDLCVIKDLSALKEVLVEEESRGNLKEAMGLCKKYASKKILIKIKKEIFKQHQNKGLFINVKKKKQLSKDDPILRISFNTDITEKLDEDDKSFVKDYIKHNVINPEEDNSFLDILYR